MGASLAAGGAFDDEGGLLTLMTHVESARAVGTQPDPDTLTQHTRLILHAATIAANDPTDTGPLANKHRALARRIHDRHHDYQAFATDPNAPFDNNAAECEIRMSSESVRVPPDPHRRQQFAAIRSYTATPKNPASTSTTH